MENYGSIYTMSEIIVRSNIKYEDELEEIDDDQSIVKYIKTRERIYE
jgi:hypothetical protein